MFCRSDSYARVFSNLSGAFCLAMLLAVCSSTAFGGATNGVIIGGNRAVGGVMVDANGVISNVETDTRDQLRDLRRQALEPLPEGAEKSVKNRMISLRRLQAAIDEKLKTFQPLPDEIRYLSGMQRVEYVIVVPEENDIILAGPGEGWVIGNHGEVVGATTGMPVLHLDDLLVALRSSDAVRNGGISCSIDPTPEGLTRYREYMSAASRNGISPALLDGMEKALGQQMITVTGVDSSTRFANVLVAADFRMKRIGMNFDPSPVRGLPSYLSMVSAKMNAMESPRWWLAPNYQPLLKDADGLTWQIRGQGVKCLAEQELVGNDGSRKSTGRTNTPAHRWADLMTEKYPELAAKEPIFADLRNCMDLAIVGALIQQYHLASKAGLPLNVLHDAARLPLASYHSPQQVATSASLLKKGSRWVVSASGGVQFQPWETIQEPETSSEVEQIRPTTEKLAEAKHWWWN